jgi:hypothetical protein
MINAPLCLGYDGEFLEDIPAYSFYKPITWETFRAGLHEYRPEYPINPIYHRIVGVVISIGFLLTLIAASWILQIILAW